MMPFIHNVKILSEYFDKVCSGEKTAELRLADRSYTEGDALVLHEYDGEKLTGKKVSTRITHVLRDSRFLKEGFVLLSFQLDEPGARISIVAWLNLYDTFLKKCKEVEELTKQLNDLRKELKK